MMADQGLPYEECKRRQEQGLVPHDRTPLYPAYAIPPFHPGTRRRRRRGDGAFVSGALTALCVVTLIATAVLAATLPA
ncbi:hypothetical protein [Streptomyces sp. NPDC046727]|uniref:hypothetical protein n=1 Tax=Streptomyces sp. NPDC046727 TaxID=3155373 RepID=UPI0033D31559